MYTGKGQFSKENQSVPFDKGTQGRCYGDTGKVKGREMRDTNTILGLIQERGRKGLPLERVYKLLFNPVLYLTAYGKIYRNNGATTPGTTSETVDSMSMEKINTIIEALRHERYRWNPTRRVYIEKKNSTKKRPLSMPSWSDKLLQEVMRLLLNAYFEPRFSDHSHGFRPERGCHTALREIYQKWPGTIWFIEGDISACFDSLDHDILLSTLSEHIHDGRFIRLISDLLKTGYMEDWKQHETLSGCPQGGIISPILSNIYLDKLDKFVEETLVPAYTGGTARRRNREYERLKLQAFRHRRKGDAKTAAMLKRQMQQMPSIDPEDPDYRRLYYIRYADDFLLGFAGPKEEAEEIKQRLGKFLQDELKLELSKTKTLITHARTEVAKFLGYELHTLQDDKKRDRSNRRNINGGVGLRVPQSVLMEKCQRYMRGEKVIHRAELLQDSDFTIIARYQSEYRGIVEYYRLAYNLGSLSRLRWLMEKSLMMTLAHKFKVSVKTVSNKYRATIKVDGKPYKGLQATRPREGKEPLVATWGGIPLKRDIRATLNDRPMQIAWNRTELEKRLLASVCEYCEATDEIQVHHIRALKDLKRYPGREKPEWVKMMAKRQRKTMVVCRTCHEDITYGRPMRQIKTQKGFMNEFSKEHVRSSS